MRTHAGANGSVGGLGSESLETVGQIALGRAEVDRSAGDVCFRAPFRGPDGTIGHLVGRGADLPAALVEGLAPLVRLPFVIADVSVADVPGTPGRVVAKVRVGSSMSDAARHAVGHAEAVDGPTAVAVAAVRGLAAGGFVKARFLRPGARDVETSTDRIVEGIERVLAESPGPETMGLVREIVSRELHRFGAGQAIMAAHAAVREGVLTRFDPQEALLKGDGCVKTSDTRTAAWWEWFPGLDNDHRTLREVLGEMPAAPPAAIPWVVRLFENPAGWLRLHGAVDLERHDMIHVLLGRGLLDQDEAFVIGFTMGSTRAVSWLERTWFKFAVSRLYPEPYRISWRTLAAFDLGLEAGRDCGVSNVHLRLGREFLDRPLGEVRRRLGIDPVRLRESYARERAALPGTLASQRLPGLPRPQGVAGVQNDSGKGAMTPSPPMITSFVSCDLPRIVARSSSITHER
jgi:hypothetical protein